MIDIRKGNVVSEQPVEMKMLQGTLNANRLEIDNSGDLVRVRRRRDHDLDAQSSPTTPHGAAQAKAGAQ